MARYSEGFTRPSAEMIEHMAKLAARPAEHRRIWDRVVDRMIVQGVISRGFGAVSWSDGERAGKRMLVMEFRLESGRYQFWAVEVPDWVPIVGYTETSPNGRPYKTPLGCRFAKLDWDAPLPDHVSWDAPPKPAEPNLEFMECDTCRAKPGTPDLCAGCLHNRAVISVLKRRLA